MICDKVVFDSEAAARKGARLATEDHGERFYFYACPACRRWHLTVVPQTGEAPRSRRGKRRSSPHERAARAAYNAAHLEEIAAAKRKAKAGPPPEEEP